MGDIGIGIDWGSTEHEVCAVSDDGAVLRKWRVRHDGECLVGLAEALCEFARDGDVFIGIECPDGAVVETLLERGLLVHTINPKQVDRFRDRYRPSGAKDDRLDAYVLARTVLSDRDCYRRVEARDPRLVQLREWTRTRDRLVKTQTRTLNRATGILRRYFPQIIELGSPKQRWLRALLRRCGTPDKARRVQRRTVEKILLAHHIRRLSPEEVMVQLRAVPLTVTPQLVDVLEAELLMLLDELDQQHEHIARCERAIDLLLAEFEGTTKDPGNAAIIRSHPGMGRIAVANFLGEASQVMDKLDLSRMRALTGAAPVSILTGKKQNRYGPRANATVQMRRARNHRLADALQHGAASAMISSEPHKLRYAAMRGRGHTHARACRQLGDQMLTVIFAMLRNRTVYELPKPA